MRQGPGTIRAGHLGVVGVAGAIHVRQVARAVIVGVALAVRARNAGELVEVIVRV